MNNLIMSLINSPEFRSLSEALKEGARVGLIGVCAILLAGINLSTSTVSVNWGFLPFIIIVSIVKAVDKWLHEIGKENNDPGLITGLTRF